MMKNFRMTKISQVFFESRDTDVVTTNENTMRPRVYNQPTLWYLRVVIIQAQNLVRTNRDVFVHAAVGNVSKSSKVSKDSSNSPTWDNEEIIFVVAEPFNRCLNLTVFNCIDSGQAESLGQCVIPLGEAHKCVDSCSAPAVWYTLNKFPASKVLMRVSLEGKYHVAHEHPFFCSDLRPSDKKLWRPPIGVLELSILNAKLKSSESRDVYCVAKYGTKWVKTRTVVDPNWDEQYSWDVYDPSALIKIGVFEGGRDSRIGMVRIRLSNLRINTTYTDSYPLIVLQPTGVKEMGEIRLAIRFTCSSMKKLLSSYLRPKLPLVDNGVDNLTSLRKEAISILSNSLSQDLRKDVVECMLNEGFDKWSHRRMYANYLRVKAASRGFWTALEWFDQIRKWKKPTSTILAHLILLILVKNPGFIFPGIFLYCFLITLWNFKNNRDLHPPQIDIQLCYTDVPDIKDLLDEEFDSVPSSKSGEVLRQRYDKLRDTAATLDLLHWGDIAIKAERLCCLLNWRDPTATFMVAFFCLLAFVLMLAVPSKVLFGVCGFYVMRHPVLRFGHDHSVLKCFFSRLPMKLDNML